LQLNLGANTMKTALIASAALAALAVPFPATANNVGENGAWQFQTPAEVANRAYVEDMRLKRIGGTYQAPQYTTYVDTQNSYNCSNNASSSGNGGTNSATANTPNSYGANGSATGNSSAQTTSSLQRAFNPVLNNGQENLGSVFAGVTGDSVAGASGNLSDQVLNTLQHNWGVQDASVNGAKACAFAGTN
jgi:hypothetical protein